MTPPAVPADLPVQPAVPAGPRHAAVTDADVITARRWTVGVLAVATALAVGWTALVLAGAWLFASAYSVVTARDALPVDVLAAVGDLAPALLVGWCLGLATVAGLGRGEALGPRLSGITAGLLGSVAGAVVLAVGPLL